jgi:NADPH-dependent glutamate synthase beta subunit-like oxidoreductase
LAKLGHAVTIFEAFPEPGGMMRVGIPEYRLPREVLSEEIEEIRRAGVEIITNTKIKSVNSLFEQGYDAVLLAVGAHQSSKLGIEGEDSPGVMEGISFLRDTNLHKGVKLSGRVGVIGGGNAAIDSARTALRAGANEVTILYRRSRMEMPADAEQVDAALAEGVKINFLVAPSKIMRHDGMLKVECIHMKLGELDKSGRRRPVPVEGSEFIVECNTLLVAIGEAPDLSFFGKGDTVQTDRGGTIRVDAINLQADMEGVFAAGDAVSGPASVIEAIAMGRKAVTSIDKYLGGSGDISEKLIDVEQPSPCLGPGDGFADLCRVSMPCLSIEQRMVPARDGSFPEVKLGFTEEMASEEAKRCLQCQLRFQISPITPPPK